MPYVLTEDSQLQCGHTGSVQAVASQSKLTVGGKPALVDGDLAGKPISGCVTVNDPNTGAKLCTAVTSALGGAATRLTVGGKAVLLEPIQGMTDGTVGGTPQTWSVSSAGQSKLQAV